MHSGTALCAARLKSIAVDAYDGDGLGDALKFSAVVLAVDATDAVQAGDALQATGVAVGVKLLLTLEQSTNSYRVGTLTAADADADADADDVHTSNAYRSVCTNARTSNSM